MKGMKTGGRVEGVPNKTTQEIRSVLKEFIYSELQSLPGYLEKLPEKERVEIVIRLIPFVCPKVDAVRFDIGEPMKIGGFWEG